jgi:outer membrane lipoprotein SlyB
MSYQQTRAYKIMSISNVLPAAIHVAEKSAIGAVKGALVGGALGVLGGPAGMAAGAATGAARGAATSGAVAIGKEVKNNFSF